MAGLFEIEVWRDHLGYYIYNPMHHTLKWWSGYGGWGEKYERKHYRFKFSAVSKAK